MRKPEPIGTCKTSLPLQKKALPQLCVYNNNKKKIMFSGTSFTKVRLRDCENGCNCLVLKGDSREII